MGMKKIYSCNICHETLKEPTQSFGLYFTTLRMFTLGNYGCTEGTHICYDCARQLHEHLNNAEIQKALNTQDITKL